MTGVQTCALPICGIRNAFSGFSRFAFGRVQRGHRRWLTLGAFLIASAVLGSLVVVDATALVLAASRAGLPDWLPRHALDDATWLALIFVECTIALAVWIATARAARAAHRGLRAIGRGLRVIVPALRCFIMVTWGLFALTIVACIACGAGIPLLLATAGTRSTPFVSAPPLVVVVAVWGGLVLATLVGRRLFVQYVGDVAAYVSPQKLDRFNDLRHEIKDVAKRVAVAIYEQSYDRVAIVGHSLGSVIAYDTLNALLSDDALRPPESRRRVLERTRLLLTVGSPLDKTAFVFATSYARSNETREALAALSQPLIADERIHAAIPWVNVYAFADPVSGTLDLYGPLTNVPDPDATTPLLAHNEYWENDLVWRTVRDVLFSN